MRHKLSVRLPEDLARWLSETARKTSWPQGQIVRDELERARKGSEKPFMRLAGIIFGPPDLSQQKGYSKK